MKEERKLDSDGTLFDPQVRAAMALFALDGGTLALETSAAVRSAAHAVERLRNRGGDSRGLSSGALDILIRLSAAAEKDAGAEDVSTAGAASSAAEGGVSIGDLAKSAGVSSRNVTGLVDTLERAGLARRAPDPRDRRSVLAQITPDGRAWMESFRGPTQAAMTALFHGFTPAELAQLRHLCLRLIDNQHQIEEHLKR